MTGSKNLAALIVPQSVREALHIVGTESEFPPVSDVRPFITVGDAVTKHAIAMGRIPNLAIIDHRTRRIPVTRTERVSTVHFDRVFHGRNDSGTISVHASVLIRSIVRHPQFRKSHTLITVTGEEDLLGVPALCYSPRGTVVYFGHRKKGILSLAVNRRLLRILRMFALSVMTVTL